MKTNDQILKLRAIVLYVLNAFPGGVDYIKLFKILYFAQRRHLVEYGRVIFDDTFQARRYGPVSGFIRKGLKLIETGQVLPEDFKTFGHGIHITDGDKHQIISTAESSDLNEMSKSEIDCLNFYISKFRDMKSEDVSELSHEDKAWQVAFNRAKKDPEHRFMSILEIAEAGGASESTLDYIRYNLELDEALN